MANPVDVTATTRASMLRMGKTWHQLGKLNQAVDTYLRIVQEYPSAEEAENAKSDLLKIAQGFEIEGRYHLAMDILDRLNQAAVVVA